MLSIFCFCKEINVHTVYKQQLPEVVYMAMATMSAYYKLTKMELIRNSNKNAGEVTVLCIKNKAERKEKKTERVLNSSSKTMLFSSSKPGC